MLASGNGNATNLATNATKPEVALVLAAGNKTIKNETKNQTVLVVSEKVMVGNSSKNVSNATSIKIGLGQLKAVNSTLAKKVAPVSLAQISSKAANVSTTQKST